MAMPKFLHAASHASPHVQVSMPDMPQESLDRLAMACTQAADMESVANGETSSSDCQPGMQDIPPHMLDCDLICALMGAGDCLSQSVSAPAIINQAQLIWDSANSDRSIQTIFWSPQTVELTLLNPPPILILA